MQSSILFLLLTISSAGLIASGNGSGNNNGHHGAPAKQNALVRSKDFLQARFADCVYCAQCCSECCVGCYQCMKPCVRHVCTDCVMPCCQTTAQIFWEERGPIMAVVGAYVVGRGLLLPPSNQCPNPHFVKIS